jgi:hypothetical protein
LHTLITIPHYYHFCLSCCLCTLQLSNPQAQCRRWRAVDRLTAFSLKRYIHIYIQLAKMYSYTHIQPWRSLCMVAGTCAFVRTTTYALCIFTHTALPAAATGGDAEAMHFHPRHLASRIIQLHLASRGISPFRPARLAMTYATARSLPCLCKAWESPCYDCTCTKYGASPSQHRISRFTTNAGDSCEPNANLPLETLSVSCTLGLCNRSASNDRGSPARKTPLAT